MNLVAASFTFHYVSILIALYQLTPKCGTDFTFHYVAILTESSKSSASIARSNKQWVGLACIRSGTSHS